MFSRNKQKIVVTASTSIIIEKARQGLEVIFGARIEFEFFEIDLRSGELIGRIRVSGIETMTYQITASLVFSESHTFCEIFVNGIHFYCRWRDKFEMRPGENFPKGWRPPVGVSRYGHSVIQEEIKEKSTWTVGTSHSDCRRMPLGEFEPIKTST